MVKSETCDAELEPEFGGMLQERLHFTWDLVSLLHVFF